MFVSNVVRKAILRIIAVTVIAIGAFSVTGISEGANAAGAQRTYKIKSTVNFKRPAKFRKYRKRVRYGHRVRRSLRKSKSSLRRSSSRRARRIVSSRKSRGLHPRLRGLLAQVRRHYGRPVIVTSGCRSYRHNRRIGGARKSMHLQCKAADIRVSGVSKARLRRYVSGLRGRGGVGGYCRSSSVHLDVGPRRSWYWGCGGKRRSKHRRKRRRS